MSREAIEQWRPITGYSGIYEVSNRGQVRSLDRVVHHPKKTQRYKGKILKQRLGGAGYLIVNLSIDGVKKTHSVHRLVAEEFVTGSIFQPHVNHIDLDRTNNGADNLEWVTQAENNAHSYRARGGIRSCVSSDTKAEIRKLRNEHSWSYAKIATHLDIDPSTVRRIAA